MSFLLSCFCSSSYLSISNSQVVAAPGTHHALLPSLPVSRVGVAAKRSEFSGGRRRFLPPLLPATTRTAIPLRWKSNRRHFTPSASLITASQIAGQAFTWGTVSVLPFYTLMLVAPNAALVCALSALIQVHFLSNLTPIASLAVMGQTRRTMESNIPYVILGVLYMYLLYLSWTPDTLRSMFASKYWLPELVGIAKMFANEMTVASAWIHLLAVDLFAARQVYLDGLKDRVETRHSVSLCLLFCPIGIVSHALTKGLTRATKGSH